MKKKNMTEKMRNKILLFNYYMRGIINPNVFHKREQNFKEEGGRIALSGFSKESICKDLDAENECLNVVFT